MRLAAVLLALSLSAPVAAFAQLSFRYELNEEGLATAQTLNLKHGVPAVMTASPGDTLTALDLPSSANKLTVERRFWYSAEANWHEQGKALGYRRAGKWEQVVPNRQHRIVLGYATGTPPGFDTAYWKKARDYFVSHSKDNPWKTVAQKCTSPTDAGAWGNADGAYCNVSADAVEFRITETIKKRKETYGLTYMLSRGR